MALFGFSYGNASRWEPFGITAIEAMASGTPVVASATGGLVEIIDDLRVSNEGNGFLVEKENIESLRSALIDSLLLSTSSETGDKSIQDQVSLGVRERSWDKVRLNAIAKVNSTFRWGTIADQAQECYSKALLMAKYRASAYL